MKKILHFFAALLLFVGTLQAQIEEPCGPGMPSCQITITGHGAYTDSWQAGNNRITIMQGDVIRGEFTIRTTDVSVAHPTYTQTYTVCSDSVQFIWTSTQYANECQFTITFNDSTIYDCGNASRLNGQFASALIECPVISCPFPRDLVAIPGTQSATVTWGETQGASNYYYEYGPHPYTPTGGVTATSDTTVTLEYLNDNTEYDFYLYAYCGADDTSRHISTSFTTPCGEATVPLTESFENNGSEVPECWTLWQNWDHSYGYGVSHGFKLQQIRMYAHTGDYYAMLDNEYGTVALASPLLPISASQVEVYYYADCWLGNAIEVGYITSLDSNATFHLVASNPTTDGWVEYHVSFANVTETEPIYVVIRLPQGSGQTVSIDDITIRAASNCAQPIALHMTETSPNTITLAWTDSINTSWEIAYGEPGFNPDEATTTLTSIFDNHATITNLDDSLLYEFYVRAACGGSYSYWQGPLEAQPNVVRVPMSGSDTMRVCGATITDHAGLNGDYDISTNGYLVLYPEDNTSTIRLQGTYNIVDDWDKLYLFDGVGTEGNPLGTYTGVGVVDTVSTVGPITLRFATNGAGNSSGFALTALCEERDACPAPYQLAVSNIAASSALATWNYNLVGGTPRIYFIDITNNLTHTTLSDSCTTTQYQMVSLTANSTYTVTVKALCESGDTSNAITTHFSTRGLPCTGADLSQNVIDSLYLGTLNASNLPSRSNYKFTLTQQVFRSEEMNDLGRITGMKFKAATGLNTRSLLLYLGHTTQASLSNFLVPDDLTLVWSDSVVFSSDQEYDITFDTPFDYNGSDNLLVVFCDTTNRWTAANPNSVYAHNNAPNNSIYTATDSAPYDPFNPPSTATTFTQRMNIIWKGNPCSGHLECVPPTVAVDTVEPHSITVSWLPGYRELSWDVDYREAGAATFISFASDYTQRTATLTGLQPNTQYEIRITSPCNDGQTAQTVVSATTPCVAISTLPFVENFDNGFIAPTSNPATEPCWTRHTSTPITSSTMYPQLSSTAFNGSNGLYFYGSSDRPAVLVLPHIDIPADSLQVTFALMKEATNFDINVGVMTDPNDVATFQTVATLCPSANNIWEQFDVPLDSYTGTGHYIAFAVTNGYKKVYLDALTVDYIPSCPRPQHITFDAATTTTADLHWTATEASSYEIEYGTHGFTLGEGTRITSPTDSIHLTGLTHSTFYDIYVRGLCGDGERGYWSFTTSFSTECDSIYLLPFEENFSRWDCGDGNTPLCWTPSLGYPQIVCTRDYNNNGKSLSFNPNESTTRYISLPPLSRNLDINNLQVSFSLSASTASTGFVVGICTEPGVMSTFTPIDTVVAPTASGWYDYEVPFSQYHAAGRYVTFKGFSEHTTSASLFLDEVSIETIPTCRRPDTLTAYDATATSVTLAWRNHSPAIQWQVEYALVADPYNATTVSATSDPFVLTGLTPNSRYTYRVRAICGDEDSSFFSRERCLFTTAQTPATLPYSYNFEDAAEWSNYLHCNSRNNVGWCRGTVDPGEGSHSGYVSADNGATVSSVSAGANTQPSNFSLYRDFDFGATDTNITLEFMAKCGGATDAVNDGLYVFITDPAIPVDAPTGNNSRISPWGDLNNLNILQSVRLSNSWNTYSIEIERVSGVKRVVFCYYNKVINSTFSGNPAQVDNIHVVTTSCPRPNQLSLRYADANNAEINWAGAADASYEVTYHDFMGNPAITYSTATNSITLSQLNNSTRYAVKVRKICGENDTSAYSDELTFATACGPVNISASHPFGEGFESTTTPAACWTMVYGDPSATNTNTMLHSSDSAHSGNRSFRFSSYNHANDYTQYLITPELNPAGELALSFWYNKKNQDAAEYLRVGHSSTTNDTADFEWSEPFRIYSTGWQHYTDTLPANTKYVAISYWANYKFYVYIDDFSLTTDAENCFAPSVTDMQTTHESATITWNGEADAYEIALKEQAAANYPAAQRVSGNSHTFTNLQPETDYMFHIRMICDSTLYSDWTEVTFTTQQVPCFTPTGLTVTATDYTTATLSWTPQGDEAQWIVKCFNSRIGGRFDTLATATATLENLSAGETYYAVVRAACNRAEGDFSAWSDTVSFTTAQCQAPSNLVCQTVSETHATLAWTAGGGEQEWILECGPVGFVRGEELLRLVVDEHPYNLPLDQLEAHSDYDVYVYAQCHEGAISVPVGPATFHTGNVAISSPYSEQGSQITIYPNPASGNTTISVSGAKGTLHVTIVDIDGRTVVSETLLCDGDCLQQLQVAHLAQGTYFVRIYGESLNSIRKLIVK